ncbi:MAG: hypothetical protein EXR75_12920 [Myxococcales bacterium]|nr:hypothetical protein [Myxococcales bacterium]
MRENAPIFGFNRDRARLRAETVARVLEQSQNALHALNDACYFEIRRLDGAKRPKDVAELDRWRSLARRLAKMDGDERNRELVRLVEDYAEDIAGNFNPRVYRATASVLPSLVTGLLSPRKLSEILRNPAQLVGLEALGDEVVVDGDLELLRRLAARGTLVFVPTHSSNMDSIVFGYALERAKLPPATYGAGKNLFTNPLLSFFMHNLGAYKVDRRIVHGLYKDCLKAYSTVLLENGYHSLFFPGGTRSRSGAIETRLKLGLMGTGVEAYTRSILARRERKIFFVPATINYLIALEAETLIEDFLTDAGKARYIIEDDESTRPGRVLAFAKKLLTMASSVVIRFGAPLDPFGLEVDAEGTSFDAHGRAVRTPSYVEGLDGKVRIDAARDGQYTRELGRTLAASYRKNTVFMATHVVAAASFEHLVEVGHGADLFTTLRLRHEHISRDELARRVAEKRDRILELEQRGEAVLAAPIRTASGGDIVAQAIAAFRGYHASPVLDPEDDGIVFADPKLLFYYQNRLARHGLAYDPDARMAARAGASQIRREPGAGA